MRAPRRLWAPWRTAYVSQRGTRSCIFCAAVRWSPPGKPGAPLRRPSTRLRLARDDPSTRLGRHPEQGPPAKAGARVEGSRADRRHHVVARGRTVFVLLNRYPYNNGHLMIAPYRHIGALADLRPGEWSELLTMLQRFTKRLRRSLRSQGFNLGLNLGRVAGAGIPGHLHVHVVPRWQGDTNFMPVAAGTKVVSQSLDALYTLLTRPGRRTS